MVNLSYPPSLSHGGKLRSCTKSDLLVRDAPFDIWGGGGQEFLLLCCFFFTPGGKQVFFWRSTSDNFLLCYVEKKICRMLSLLCTLPFGVFSGQHIFHQFRQQTFFFCSHSPPPPPQISNDASLNLSAWSQ